MKVSVDISLYPLKKEFEKDIIAFILKLRQTNFKIIDREFYVRDTFLEHSDHGECIEISFMGC